MNTKLTLNLDKKVIEQAKKYAQKKQCSLSGLVETYFRFLIDQEQSTPGMEMTPTVKELSGIIQLDDTADIHEDYTDYLLQKYR